jgi:predicted DNA-binding protein
MVQKKLGVAVAPELADRLKELSERTDIPQARLLRQALELLFEKYEDVLREPKASKARK